MLKQRILTALVLVLVLGGVLFGAPRIMAALVFALIAALGGWEWARLIGGGTVAGRVFPAVVFGLCLLLTQAPAMGVPLLALASAFWFLLVPFWFRSRWSFRADIVGWAIGLLVLLSTFVAMDDMHRGQGPVRLLAVMAIVWIADIAAYFCGRMFGRHKLAPSISPGKTWEGVAGAVVAVEVYGCLMLRIFEIDVVMPVAIFLLAVLTMVSVAGDLFESMLKRQAGMKDSSALLPGHGGILDRIDSLTATLPPVALFIALTSP